MLDATDLPNDIAELKALLIAATARGLRKDDRIARLEKLVAAFKQAAFGRKSEKINPEQFDLALEDLETAIAAIHAEDEADTASTKPASKPRAINRGSLPKHLPRIDEVIEPESLIAPAVVVYIALAKIFLNDWMWSLRSFVSLSRIVLNTHAAPVRMVLCKRQLQRD